MTPWVGLCDLKCTIPATTEHTITTAYVYYNNNTTAIFKYAKLLLQYIISSFQWYIYQKRL